MRLNKTFIVGITVSIACLGQVMFAANPKNSKIEAAVEKLAQKEDVSINSFIRNIVLDKCKKVIGKDAFDKLNENKLNVVKAKK